MNTQASTAITPEQHHQSLPAPVQSNATPQSHAGKEEHHHVASSPTSVTVRPTAARRLTLRRLLLVAALALALTTAAYRLTPYVQIALNTVSTDDAYINGHVTFVAPRVTGQVSRVFVDDNDRVSKGDLLVELDREPYEVQVAIKKAAVETAQADLATAEAQVHALVAQARSSRFNLEHTIESVRNQLATLRSNVAQLKVEEANLQLAERDYVRTSELMQRKAASQADFDQYVAKRDVAA